MQRSTRSRAMSDQLFDAVLRAEYEDALALLPTDAARITDRQIDIAKTHVSTGKADEMREAREQARNLARVRAATKTTTASDASRRETHAERRATEVMR